MNARKTLEDGIKMSIATVCLEAADAPDFQNLTGPEALRLVAKRAIS